MLTYSNTVIRIFCRGFAMSIGSPVRKICGKKTWLLKLSWLSHWIRHESVRLDAIPPGGPVLKTGPAGFRETTQRRKLR